jgi:transposase
VHRRLGVLLAGDHRRHPGPRDEAGHRGQPHPQEHQAPTRPDLYALRYRVECGFHALKRFRAVATRYDKTATSFLAAVHVACLWMWLVD